MLYMYVPQLLNYYFSYPIIAKLQFSDVATVFLIMQKFKENFELQIVNVVQS